MSAERLAREACEIEIEILGHPIGKQDQYAAAYGGFNYIRFNPDESVFIDPVIFKKETKEELNKKLLLFYTGITRISSTILDEQQNNISDNSKYLDEMIKLSETMKESLIVNDIGAFGELLHEGWKYKRNLASAITTSLIDQYYEKARNAGAVGGKIVGAGGGGFLLFYCEEKFQNRVCEALSDLKETPMHFEPQGSKIIYVSD